MPLPTSEEIGHLIAGWRKEARLSQEELAQRIGRHQRTISFMEAGRSMTVENLWAVLDHFGRGLSDLSSEPSGGGVGAPRTHPQPPEPAVPLELHLAALQALREAQEQTAIPTRPERDYSPAAVGAKAEEGAAKAVDHQREDESPAPGSDRSKSRPRRGTRR